MLSKESIFIDAQYLKFFDAKKRISLFSRARATSDYYTPNTNLFSGAYLNYTTKSGFGGTLIGRISSSSRGVDTGIHYFKNTKSFMVYALSSININKELFYSWFSILRYTPHVYTNYKLFTSLELFSAFAQVGHLSSVQRAYLGLDKKGYQFGFATHVNQSRSSGDDVNFGIFIRKTF